MKRLTCLMAFLLLSWMLHALSAQEVAPEKLEQLAQCLDQVARREVAIGPIRIDSVALTRRSLQLFANDNAAYIPYREENVAEIYRQAGQLLAAEKGKRRLEIFAMGRRIEEWIPLMMRPGKTGRKERFAPENRIPLLTRVDAPYQPVCGLAGRHLALWQSHGWYFEQKLDRWEWQRARIFQTVEDLYTQSYVLPFLLPMLERAGANVLLPRERDCQSAEVVVDNDGSPQGIAPSLYREQQGETAWTTGREAGFAHLRSRYEQGQNPFREGTYRQTTTVRQGVESLAEWVPTIPQRGDYAVYVSYHSLPGSSEDALYTVHHRGGETRFRINQQMGGGTWIYLGTFSFDAGQNESGRVTLSNRSARAGRILTADGVKIGGGMGQVARGTRQETSGYPRWCEGARYWLQWAGLPDSIYSPTQGTNDYNDDYRCRGMWVNYLAGGSSTYPEGDGLHIPVDMAFAFHTDAGTTLNDSIIGTLGIYMTDSYGGVFEGGASRYLSHDLTDLVQSQIVSDIRTLYEPQWSRRGKWNKSYAEARVPRVPTMLLELLSHQNLADMRYGLDPQFRFTVSRAIYKAMLRFLAWQRGQEAVVQPLPVRQLSLTFASADEALLAWQPETDPLEPTATADGYVVYTRRGEGAFDNGQWVSQPQLRVKIAAGEIYSFKVTAVNRGGESFDSEILSIGRPAGGKEKGSVLVVNGFDRISAPDSWVAPASGDTLYAGFLDSCDHGVPYLRDISYIGSQKEFRRQVPWMDDDASGFGDSYGDYETQVIAGNSFDYPALHGQAILQAGYRFASASRQAVEQGELPMEGYTAVDLILGKQKQYRMGRGVMPARYKTFTPALQQALARYLQQGGRLLASGAYIASDLWDNPAAPSQEADRRFATEVLKYKWRVGQAARRGVVKGVSAPADSDLQLEFHQELNGECYVVESPDAVEPACPEAHTFLRYAENNLSAAVAYRGAYACVVLGFPFESIRTAPARQRLMQAVLDYMNSNYPNN